MEKIMKWEGKFYHIGMSPKIIHRNPLTPIMICRLE